jgi:ribonucleotide reductase beta subunit family protein with ferritin-like domain
MLNSVLVTFPKIDKDEVKNMVVTQVNDAIELEIEWLTYLTKNEMVGFSKDSIEWYIKGKWNELTSGIKMGELYDVPRSPLYDIEAKHKDPNRTRTNQFETRPSTYDAKSLSDDGYL